MRWGWVAGDVARLLVSFLIVENDYLSRKSGKKIFRVLTILILTILILTIRVLTFRALQEFPVTHSSMSSESFVNQLEEKQIIGLFGLGSE